MSDEKAPLPADLPASAPVLNDPERGSVEIEKEQAKKDVVVNERDKAELPRSQLLVIMSCLSLVLFIIMLDQTLVATALPTIAEELGATAAEYSWTGTSYLLSMTALTPINGQISEIVGRKPMLFGGIVIFTIFSALCGAAKNMTWLIVSRALQGVGGGIAINMIMIVVSDIVPLAKRGAYMGFVAGAMTISSVLGPILGGVFTQYVTWRWGFYINLPTCGVALVSLFFFLKINRPPSKYTLETFRTRFDFIGLLLVVAGGAILVVAFAEATDEGFKSPKAYALIIVGVVLMAAAIVNFCFTKRNPIIPPRMFTNRTALFFLIIGLLSSMGFMPTNFLLPQLFQGLHGATPTESGVQMLPFAVITGVMTIVSGGLMSKLQITRPLAWVGFSLATLGYGLFYRFMRFGVSQSVQEGIQVIPAMGIGLALQIPLTIIQSAMPEKDAAAAVVAFMLTRPLGSSIGIAIFEAILNSGIRSRFAEIPGYGTTFTAPTSSAGYAALHDIPDVATRDAALTAFADSLGVCWIVTTALMGASVVLSAFTRHYSLKRGLDGNPEKSGNGLHGHETSSSPASGTAEPAIDTVATEVVSAAPAELAREQGEEAAEEDARTETQTAVSGVSEKEKEDSVRS